MRGRSAARTGWPICCVSSIDRAALNRFSASCKLTRTALQAEEKLAVFLCEVGQLSLFIADRCDSLFLLRRSQSHPPGPARAQTVASITWCWRFTISVSSAWNRRMISSARSSSACCRRSASCSAAFLRSSSAFCTWLLELGPVGGFDFVVWICFGCASFPAADSVRLARLGQPGFGSILLPAARSPVLSPAGV